MCSDSYSGILINGSGPPNPSGGGVAGLKGAAANDSLGGGHSLEGLGQRLDLDTVSHRGVFHQSVTPVGFSPSSVSRSLNIVPVSFAHTLSCPPCPSHPSSSPLSSLSPFHPPVRPLLVSYSALSPPPRPSSQPSPSASVDPPSSAGAPPSHTLPHKDKIQRDRTDTAYYERVSCCNEVPADKTPCRNADTEEVSTQDQYANKRTHRHWSRKECA